jgi:hypothetical protein
MGFDKTSTNAHIQIPHSIIPPINGNDIMTKIIIKSTHKGLFRYDSGKNVIIIEKINQTTYPAMPNEPTSISFNFSTTNTSFLKQFIFY